MLVAPIAFANLLAPEIAEVSKYSGQNSSAMTSCDACIPGTYQTETESKHCRVCETGQASAVVARGTPCNRCQKGRINLKGDDNEEQQEKQQRTWRQRKQKQLLEQDSEAENEEQDDGEKGEQETAKDPVSKAPKIICPFSVVLIKRCNRHGEYWEFDEKTAVIQHDMVSSTSQ